MTRYLFVSESPVVLSAPALPDLAAEFAADAPFTVWDSRTAGADLSADLFNAAGTALLVEADLVTDGSGQLPPFRGTDNAVIVWIDFGGGLPRAPIVSPEAVQNILDAWIAGTIGGSGIEGAPSVWPPTFPADLHTHLAEEISNSTAVGRALMKAADAQSARAAIGAMASTFTGLQIGTTGTTAAAGNHAHPATAVQFTPAGVITGTNVQTAIEQAAQTGGSGSGTAAIDVWKYASGAYPALPATQPPGLKTMYAQGPVQPTTLPSWAGVGPSDVSFFYDEAPLV